MKTSVAITVFNEEKSIYKLLDGLINQTKKPDEIVIVDGGSTDKTVELIKKFTKNTKYKIIKLIIKPSTRVAGRNMAVKSSKNQIIAITDADCVAKKNWLENITKAFNDNKVDMVAGFYEMSSNSNYQIALAPYLGVMPSKFNTKTFLPSTRSIAFRKSLWKEVGGFPDRGKNSAEDTEFNYLVVRSGVGIARAKNAQVIWSIPDNIDGTFKKFSDYAKWDAEAKVAKRHLIKNMSVFTRYFIFILILYYSYSVFLILFITYLFWSIWKMRRLVPTEALLFVPLIQVTADIAVMMGFIRGIIRSNE